MKRLFITALLAVSAPAAFGFGFSDIQLWAGSGSNQSALVVDWNDGSSAPSLAWGFRWDGAASGLDLITAVVSADPRLKVEIVHFDFGDAVRGFAYDADLDGVNEHFAAGFGFPGEGYWGYYLGSGAADPSWGFSGVGPSDRALANQSWDGWSWTPSGGEDTFPSAPTAAPVPEPASLVALGLGVLALRRRFTRSV